MGAWLVDAAPSAVVAWRIDGRNADRADPPFTRDQLTAAEPSPLMLPDTLGRESDALPTAPHLVMLAARSGRAALMAAVDTSKLARAGGGWLGGGGRIAR